MSKKNNKIAETFPGKMELREAINQDTVGRQELLRYLISNKIAPADFARASGLSRVQVSHLTTGRRPASLKVASAIEEASGGEIRATSWAKALPKRSTKRRVKKS